MRDLNLIVIHCADTPSSMDIGATEIRQWHIERGWSDIGYHFVIQRSGLLELGRDISKQGAHAKGHNKNSIGVCLVGGKGGFNFTQAQMWTLNELAERLTTKYGDMDVIGHRDVSDKPCPQFDVKEWFKEV